MVGNKMANLEEGTFLIKGEELTKRLRESYNEGYAEGYERARSERADKKGNPNELEELLKEWSEKQE